MNLLSLYATVLALKSDCCCAIATPSSFLCCYPFFSFSSSLGVQQDQVGPHQRQLRPVLRGGTLGLWSLYSSFQQLAIAIPEERSNGTLKRLVGSPMHPVCISSENSRLNLHLYLSSNSAARDRTLQLRHPPSPLDVLVAGLRVDQRARLTASSLLASRSRTSPRMASQRRRWRRHRALLPVHVGRVLRLRQSSQVDAGHRGGVPTEVDGPSHAWGLPTKVFREPRGRA